VLGDAAPDELAAMLETIAKLTARAAGKKARRRQCRRGRIACCAGAVRVAADRHAANPHDGFRKTKR